MKTKLILFILTLCPLLAQNQKPMASGPPKQVVTLEDIRECKIPNDDPFENPLDLHRLDQYEKALKHVIKIEDPSVREEIRILIQVVTEDFRVEAERQIMSGWRNQFSHSGKVEINDKEIWEMWKKSPWKRIVPSYLDGKPVECDRCRKITPLGLGIIDDTGFKTIPFDKLSREFSDVFFWNEEQTEEYRKSRDKSANDSERKIRSDLAAMERKATPSVDKQSPPLSAERVIKNNAEKEWKTDYRMVAYEIQRQTAAYNQLQAYRKSSDAIIKEVVRKAENEWKNDFRMVVYEIENQLKAKAKIDRSGS